jgi:uncharacterized integral membrane protein
MQKDGGYLEHLMNEFLGGKKRKGMGRRMSEMKVSIGERRKSSSLAVMTDGKEGVEGADVPMVDEGDDEDVLDTVSDDDSEGEEEEDENAPKKAGAALVVAEERDTGSVSWAVYKNYVAASGGWGVWLLLAIMLAGIQCARIGADVWLSYWSTQRFDFPNSTYILVYFVIGIAQAIFIFGAFFFCAFVGYYGEFATSSNFGTFA